MDRREFLEQVAAWSAGACLATPVFNVQSILAAEGKAQGRSLLAVAKGKDYGALAEQLLKPLGGMAAFVSKGDRVVVKPNIGWDRTPEQGANTHPDVVKAHRPAMPRRRRQQVLVFDRAVNDHRRTYVKSGIQAAVESMGDSRAQCVFQDRTSSCPCRSRRPNRSRSSSSTRTPWRPSATATSIVPDGQAPLPVEAHHRMKNVMGVIGGNRGEIHKGMDQRIADLNLVVRPKLTIIDVTRILLRNGPTGGKLEDVKVVDTLIASADPVAADAYATTLFDMKPEELGSTVAAAKLGLGEMDLSKVKIVNV